MKRTRGLALGDSQSMIARWLLLIVTSLLGELALAGVHHAPIIVPAHRIRAATGFPTANYRMFRRGPNGEAVAVPFQIDEVNKLGDYVLPSGPKPNTSTADGIFDQLDELSFMGDDVGDVGQPTKWPGDRVPDKVFELRMLPPSAAGDLREGALYLGLFYSAPPPSQDQKYVIFDLGSSEIRTSRYRYRFDRQNYLVVNGIDMAKPNQPDWLAPGGGLPLIDSSTFYAKADLRYFLTVQFNHRSVNSRLEAFKSGPIRTIVRVTFLYTFLKLNFEVGMYTEVSFFSNSVILPAVIYNPMDGIKNLNKGSGFYYGFALHDSPQKFQFDTNMRPYSELSNNQGLLNFFQRDQAQVEREYWASLIGDDRMMYVSLRPSRQMLQDGNTPYYFLSQEAGDVLKKRDNNQMLALTQSPVNLGLYFDLTKFREGEHLMAFQLFFENKKDYKSLEVFKNLNRWMMKLSRM